MLMVVLVASTWTRTQREFFRLLHSISKMKHFWQISRKDVIGRQHLGVVSRPPELDDNGDAMSRAAPLCTSLIIA